MNGGSDLSHRQITAWLAQIEVLQSQLRQLVESRPSAAQWHLLLEYSLPIIRRRPDAVLLADGHIVVIEYKAGQSESASKAWAQAVGYALDLQDFHEKSRGRVIVPLALGNLVGTPRNPTSLGGVVASNALGAKLLAIISELGVAPTLDPMEWATSRYFAVPSLIQAAAAIYEKHDVREISHSKAGSDNLEATLRVVIEAASYAKSHSKHVLCVVTGIPGAGKTLAGLNALSHLLSTLELEKDQAAFLSGNQPLVRILRRALADSEAERTGRRVGVRKLESVIQLIHRFVADSSANDEPPAHRIVIFDEAQRAWSQERYSEVYERQMSEPEALLDIMSRHRDWAVVIALVGGGQEIHKGEAGLSAWGTALLKASHWQLWTSSVALDGGSAVAGARLFEGAAFIDPSGVTVRPELHLGVARRSYLAEASASWVNAVLEGDVGKAMTLAGSDLPVYLTRDLAVARRWLAQQIAPNRRVGLIASSGASRLRAEGVEPPAFKFMSGVDYVKWFLAQDGDVRSSNQLEVAMSEFELQGLELDHVGLLWGGDLLFRNGSLEARRFSRTAWSGMEKDDVSSRLTVNKYRVLMTRYRKNMVIFVPMGSSHDGTCAPEEFEGIAAHLVACGVQPLRTSLEVSGSER
jgi:hypothetical protein